MNCSRIGILCVFVFLCFTTITLFVLKGYLFCVLCIFYLVVSASAIDCLERLVSEMTYYVCVGWHVKTQHNHSLRS